MRILKVSLHTIPQVTADPGHAVAALLRERLPRQAPLVVSHVSVLAVSDQRVELALFMSPGLECPRLRARAVMEQALVESGAFHGWTVGDSMQGRRDPGH